MCIRIGCCKIAKGRCGLRTQSQHPFSLPLWIPSSTLLPFSFVHPTFPLSLSNSLHFFFYLFPSSTHPICSPFFPPPCFKHPCGCVGTQCPHYFFLFHFFYFCDFFLYIFLFLLTFFFHFYYFFVYFLFYFLFFSKL